LLEQRENLCQEITKIWRELYNRYEDNTKIHCTYKSPSKLCDYYVFGEFHKELKAAGILTEVQHHHWTPKYLVSIIEKVLETIFAHLNDPVRFNSDDHYKCLGFRTDVVSRMKSELNKIALVPWVPSAEPNGAKERSWDNLLSEYNSRTEVEVVRY
jgi:hypothetical protein